MWRKMAWATKVGCHLQQRRRLLHRHLPRASIAQAAERWAWRSWPSSTFPDDTNTDFSVQLTAAKDGGADLVFLPIYYTPASLILDQAKAMGYEPTFFGVRRHGRHPDHRGLRHLPGGGPACC